MSQLIEMKIGVITVFAVPNYGAMLQSYALSTHLRKQGHAAEVVNYRQPALDKLYRFRLSFPPAVNHWLRLKRCAAFVNGRIPHSGPEYTSKEQFISAKHNYDAFITGSDQVWFTGPVQHYDPLFFLDFPSGNARKISYAASAGGTENFGEFTPRVKAALRDFSSIGVRDTHTASLVDPLTEKPLTETVDPTFLHDFTELLRPASPSREPYMLVFGNFKGASADIIKKISERTGIKKIVSLQYACHAATQRIAAPGPEEWLNWFRHASFVVTSYFHGTAFALKFQRPFVSIPTQGRVFKVRTLLQPLGLDERCLTGNDFSVVERLASKPIDWNIIEAAHAPRIEHSKNFLRQALS